MAKRIIPDIRAIAIALGIARQNLVNWKGEGRRPFYAHAARSYDEIVRLEPGRHNKGLRVDPRAQFFTLVDAWSIFVIALIGGAWEGWSDKAVPVVRTQAFDELRLHLEDIQKTKAQRWLIVRGGTCEFDTKPDPLHFSIDLLAAGGRLYAMLVKLAEGQATARKMENPPRGIRFVPEVEASCPRPLRRSAS